MAEVKRNNAKFLLGINEKNSGTLYMLKFSRNGVIQLSDENVHVKRPNQYSKKL